MAATVNSSAEVELKITPSVLNFPPPLNRVVKNQLVLKNESEVSIVCSSLLASYELFLKLSDFLSFSTSLPSR